MRNGVLRDFIYISICDFAWHIVNYLTAGWLYAILLYTSVIIKRVRVIIKNVYLSFVKTN